MSDSSAKHWQMDGFLGIMDVSERHIFLREIEESSLTAYKQQGEPLHACSDIDHEEVSTCDPLLCVVREPREAIKSEMFCVVTSYTDDELSRTVVYKDISLFSEHKRAEEWAMDQYTYWHDELECWYCSSSDAEDYLEGKTCREMFEDEVSTSGYGEIPQQDTFGIKIKSVVTVFLE